MTQAQLKETPVQLITGTPVYARHNDQRGWIYTAEENNADIFTIGSNGLEKCRLEIHVLWENETQSKGLSEQNVQHWAEDARHEPAGENFLNDLLHRIQDKEAKSREERRERQMKAEEERQAFIETIRPLIPTAAKAVIVAEMVEDQCDFMSDYHGSTTTNTIILAFSNHTRDLFAEMRKAARNHEATAHLADAPDDAEHRQKYSMGGGYFLKDGYRHSNGWKISKRHIGEDGDARAERVPMGEISLPKAPQKQTRTSGTQNPKSQGVTIEEHTHTKKGFQMWIVCQTERVEREIYLEQLATARTLGGWYSRKWGTTPAGFAFKDKGNAEQFAETLTTGNDTPPNDPAPKPNLADKLEAIADSLQKDIDHKRADRRENTPKQRLQATNARQDADDIERTQKGLRELSKLHREGNAPALLSCVQTKKEALQLGAERYDYSQCRYYDAGRPTGKPADTSDKAKAFWQLIAPKTEEEKKADKIREIEAKIANTSGIAGYFPTPPAIVAKLIDAADVQEGQLILEPSAGCGRIAQGIRDAGALPLCVEPYLPLANLLKLKGFDVYPSQFEDAELTTKAYDRVIMNPPFEKGQDVDHVKRAYSLLKDGGRLVAIMSPSFQFRQQRKFSEFREWLDTVTHEVEALPSGSFKPSGTNVETVMITIEKEA